MVDISNDTYTSIYKFCRKLTSEYLKDRSRWDGRGAYMRGYIPDGIQMDRSNGDDLILFGDYYWLYNEVLSKLRKELTLEYLEDGDLKDLLWHFVCEIITHCSTYRKDVTVLKNAINEFCAKISKPLEDYELLVPILNLDAKDTKIKIGKVIVKKFDEESLKKWGVSKHSIEFGEFADKTMAIVIEKGNNPSLVCKRAIREVDFVIHVLQVSLSTTRFIHDIELLYEQSDKRLIRKKEDPKSVALVLYGRKPHLRDIGGEIEQVIKNFVTDFSDVLEEKIPLKLRTLFKIAMTWIGRAIEEDDPDIKICYLSTALETLLTTRSDLKKGETLAYRMLLLNSRMNEPFVYPAMVLWIYELRSKVIHGSRLAVASKDDYQTMKSIAIETLIFSHKVICENELRTHADFIKILESHSDTKKILHWLEEQGDKRSLQIKEHIEKYLDKRPRVKSRFWL